MIVGDFDVCYKVRDRGRKVHKHLILSGLSHVHAFTDALPLLRSFRLQSTKVSVFLLGQISDVARYEDEERNHTTWRCIWSISIITPYTHIYNHGRIPSLNVLIQQFPK